MKNPTKKPEAEAEDAPADDKTSTFEVILQPRHAIWVQRRAEIEGITPSQFIERSIRRAWADDPYRTQIMGGPSLGGSVKASDFKP